MPDEETFYHHYYIEREKKASNQRTLSLQKYQKLIDEIKELKSTSTIDKKNCVPRNYWLLKHYDVLSIQGVEKLIVPMKNETDSIIYYVHDDEVFGILNDIHVATGHGGRDRMLRQIGEKYKNITRNSVTLLLSLCQPCQQKQKKEKKGIVTNPMIFKDLNSRCQVDLIDYQSQADRDCKFVLVYQDHLTKFVILRALQSKKAEEVAQHLRDIFSLFGAPTVLQSDNGREFVNKVIESLKDLWPTLKLVHGKPRHSQSQGSVERANQDIENMITTWMQDKKTNKWSEALHSGIKTSPYEAMFGCKPKVGLNSSNLPQELIQTITTEEEFENLLNDNNRDNDPQELIQTITTEEKVKNLLNDNNRDRSVVEGNTKELSASTSTEEKNVASSSQDKNEYLMSQESNNNDISCGVCEKICNFSDLEACGICRIVIHISCGVQQANDEKSDGILECLICNRKRNINNNREFARENLENQAKRMKTTSDNSHPAPSVGSTVRIPVPEVDRGRGDARSILAVVLEENSKDGFYRLGTNQGVINGLYSRSQFSVCPKNLISIDEVPQDTSISLRSTATAQSVGHGQGFIKCLCKTKCQSKKCACRKTNVLCTSKCHHSLSCTNK